MRSCKRTVTESYKTPVLQEFMQNEFQNVKSCKIAAAFFRNIGSVLSHYAKYQIKVRNAYYFLEIHLINPHLYGIITGTACYVRRLINTVNAYLPAFCGSTKLTVPADIHVYPAQTLCVCGILRDTGCAAVTYRKEKNMKIYLIDFENVKSKGLTGIDSLTEYDRVIIFYSENADTINFEMHQKVLISKAEVEYFKVHVGGKNALDFQLSTLLGYLVCKNYYSHIFVISNDKSFDFLHDFWHGKYIASPDCVVYRTKTIAQAINYAGGKKQAVIEDEEPDTAIIEETATENAPAVNEVPLTVPAAEKEKPAPQETAAKPEVTAKAETPAANEQFTEKRAPKPAAKKNKPVRNVRKAAAVQDDTEYTISEAELDALEASFSPYTIIRPVAEPAPAQEVKKYEPEVKAEEAAPARSEETATAKTETAETAAKTEENKPAQIIAEPAKEDKPAGKKPADKNVKKNGKGFFQSLKEALKKSDCKPTEVNHISQLLINSDTKEEFHNALAKDYKQDATELYKLLRPRYLRLKEMYAAEHPEYVDPDTVIVAAVENEKPAQADEKAADKPAEKPAETAKPEETVPASIEDSAERSEKAEKADKNTEKAEEKPAAKKKIGRPKKNAKAERSDGEKPARKPRTKKNTDKPAEVPVAADGDRLAQLLDGKCSAEETELIRQLFREVETRQQFYLRMIKQFGKKSGCVYYNAIKPEYEALSAAIK